MLAGKDQRAQFTCRLIRSQYGRGMVDEGAASIEAEGEVGAPTEDQSHRVVRLARKVPFTIIGTVVLLATAVVTGTVLQSVWDKPWFPEVAYGLPAFEAGRWTSVATGTLFAISAIGVAVVFALMCGFAEYRMGTWRTVVTFFAGQVIGILAAAAFLAVARDRGWYWADQTALLLDVGSSAGGMAALSAATATLTPPWRGRARFLIVMYCAVSFLYVGAIWDLEHAIAVTFGLLVGPVLLGRRPQLPSWQGSRREWRMLAAAFTFFVALGALVGAIIPASGPLAEPSDITDTDGPGFLGIVLIVLLLLWSDGLRRGRRVAWRWVVGLSALIVFGALLPPYTADSIYTGLLMAVLLVILILGRSAFTARGNRAVGAGVWSLLGLGLAALIAYSALGFLLIRGFSPAATIDSAMLEASERITLGAGELIPTTILATVFLASLPVLWWGLVLVAFVLVLWSNQLPAPGVDRERSLELLRRYGGTNLSWMTTWPENSYWFSPDGQAVVAYQVHAGVAIGLADPIGPADSLVPTLRQFADHTETQGTPACLFSVTEAVAAAAREMGWRTLQVAEEAIVDLPDLEFRGKAWQDVRTAINRAKKESVTFELGRLADMSANTLRQVRAISEAWVSEKGLPEMGFTLGGVEEALDPEVRVGLAVTADGTVDGVTSWLPILAPGGAVRGWTLDLMRRRDGGFRPVTEFLIASACLAFKDEGAQVVSLSGAPLARADADAEVTALERVLDSVGEAMEPLYGFRSLHQFKAKFQPRYAPISMAYPDEAALPRIGVAIGRAYLPTGLTAVLTHR